MSRACGQSGTLDLFRAVLDEDGRSMQDGDGMTILHENLDAAMEAWEEQRKGQYERAVRTAPSRRKLD